MQLCTDCGSSNAEGARFCSGCGLELVGETTRQSSAQTQPPTGADSLLHSKIAGKYRLDAKLGAGGMGTVYRATRLLIGDEVAVKILHSEQNDPKAAERFRREARAAARLKHPNAVTIHDFGVTDDGLQYLVMELVEGESLRQIIRKQGTLTPTVCAWIIGQVCAALDEAHRHNIIHRDIKPDNLIVNETTSGSRVKVLDFGIAKLRDDAGENLTLTGTILGTPHYMSPEQCLGEEIDGRSDIYSLGVVLYEMLCGVVPFHSATPSAVVVQHVNQPPPSLRSKDPSISQAVDRVVLRTLAKQRDARPGTAAILAHELAVAVNESVGIGGKETEEATRVAEDGRRRKRAVQEPREAGARRKQAKDEERHRQNMKEAARKRPERVADSKHIQQVANSIWKAVSTIATLFLSTFIVAMLKPPLWQLFGIAGRSILVTLFMIGVWHLAMRLREDFRHYTYRPDEIHYSITQEDRKPDQRFKRSWAYAFLLGGYGISLGIGLFLGWHSQDFFADLSLLYRHHLQPATASLSASWVVSDLVFYPPMAVLIVDALIRPPIIGRAGKSKSSVSPYARIYAQGLRALVCLLIGLILLFMVRFQGCGFCGRSAFSRS